MKGLIIALQFLTRIPLKINLNITEKEFGSCTKFFPLVGLVIGLILMAIYSLTYNLLPEIAVGAIILISQIILTGGIHLDGFMDTMDGLLSARPQEVMLEIMKDSRVGAHSVTALFCLLILKFSLLISLPREIAPYLLLIMPGIGYWVMVFCLAFFPYARPKGLGKIFHQETKKKYWYLSTFFMGLLFLLFFPPIYLLIPLISFLIILSPALLINKALGGHTGDTYGAINELAQVIFF